VLLTQQNLLPRLPRRGLKTICLDADGGTMGVESRENPATRATPEDVAYIIYTSGSTGKPKGVAVPHRAVNRLVLQTNYIDWTRPTAWPRCPTSHSTRPPSRFGGPC